MLSPTAFHPVSSLAVNFVLIVPITDSKSAVLSVLMNQKHHADVGLELEWIFRCRLRPALLAAAPVAA